MRCAKARYRKPSGKHRTKGELALLIVQRARARGLKYEWIGGEEIDGNNKPLTDALEDMGEIFLMDINRNHGLYEEDPRPRPKEGNPGRRSRPACHLEPCLGQRGGRKVLRARKPPGHHSVECQGSVARPAAERCWPWEGKTTQARPRPLVAREEADGSFKYSLTNASESTDWETLAYRQAQRFWIERAFQDAKSELGMAQYEVRSWRGWRHHIALVCLAHLFVRKERLLTAKYTPLLSARDIVELSDYYLLRRDHSEDQIFASMQLRHHQRQRDLARRKNKPATSLTK